MVNQQLIEYIKTNTEKGYSLEQINNYLIQQGYNPSEIKQAINNINFKRNTSINNKSTKKIKLIYVLIIILILLLAFGLFFLRLLIAKSPNKMAVGIQTLYMINPANNKTPITFNNQFIVEEGGKKELIISFFNTGNDPIESAKPIFTECYNDKNQLNDLPILLSIPYLIKPYEERRFIVRIKSGNLNPGNYNCTLNIDKTYEDIIFTVI